MNRVRRILLSTAFERIGAVFAGTVIVWALIVLLAGCGPSKDERATKFGKRCGEAGFTVTQCALLFEMAEKASDDADSAAVVGGVAIGVAAGAGARR